MSGVIRHRIFFQGDEEQLKEMFKIVRNQKKKISFDFNNIIPMPDTVYDGVLNAEALAAYGDNNWYEWHKKNWGTHNNAYNPRFYGHMLEFETNCGVPRPIFTKLTSTYDKTEITVMYSNEDGTIVGKEEYTCGNFQAIESTPENEITAALWSKDNVTFI